MNYEARFTSLVWITSLCLHRIDLRYSSMIIPTLEAMASQWWITRHDYSCGTLAGAIIPNGKGLHINRIAPRKEVVIPRKKAALARHSVWFRGR